MVLRIQVFRVESIYTQVLGIQADPWWMATTSPRPLSTTSAAIRGRNEQLQRRRISGSGRPHGFLSSRRVPTERDRYATFSSSSASYRGSGLHADRVCRSTVECIALSFNLCVLRAGLQEQSILIRPAIDVVGTRRRAKQCCSAIIRNQFPCCATTALARSSCRASSER